jgi:hypothetical protein
LWILTFQKSVQMDIFINNDILSKNFCFHFDHITCGKYYQTNNLITQDLWVHLQLFKN